MKRREFVAALRTFDIREKYGRGKGSHRMLYLEKNGEFRSIPLPFHGKNRDIHPEHMKTVLRRFGLRLKRDTNTIEQDPDNNFA